jgi:uncharacterized membrane protein YoaK (UPF0700 family)
VSIDPGSSGAGSGPGEPRTSLLRGLFRDPRHGRLPAILLTLTVVTGLVDAVSILALGRVFVANMTGNVVFIGFAIAGAPGFSLSASLAALGGFLVGALGAGPVTRRLGDRRTALLQLATTVELSLLVVTIAISWAAGSSLGSVVTGVLAATLAIAMGIQNATARHVAVPDLTTTVLTMTLTGIAADLHAGRGGAALGRRLLAVVAMLAGAVGGALLVLHVSVPVALGVAAALMAAAALLAWTTPKASGAAERA